MHLHLIRLTLETVSPLSLGSGRVVRRRRPTPTATGDKTEEHAADAIVRDANGLPTLPGPSYQGVLKRLARTEWGRTQAEEIFGIEGDRPEDGKMGTVDCGWGLVHDARDNAVRPLPGLAGNDAVLDWLREEAPLWRDHVALGHQLSVEGRKKFARAAVPRGARFSLELAHLAPGDDVTLIKVAALFRHPEFRLGSARNRGYGRLRVIRASHSCIALKESVALRRLRAQAPSVALATDLLADPRFAPPEGQTTVLTVRLTADGLLRMGAATEATAALTAGSHGARAVSDGTSAAWWDEDTRQQDADQTGQKKGADNTLRLLTEPVIAYPPDGTAGSAEVITAQHVIKTGAWTKLARLGFPVPGSQLRQPVAHRSLFNLNRAAGRVVDAEAYVRADNAGKARMEAELADHSRRPAELAELFGAAKGPSVNGKPSPGRAGRLLADDSEITAEWVMAVDHASIDRFTGSVRDRTGALFAEEVLYGAKLEASFRISPRLDTRGQAIGGWPPEVCDAFLKALRDLCTGHLPIGARSLGACNGWVHIGGHDADTWRERAMALGLPLAEGEARQ
mgnify:CR=1 FL=1